MKNVLILEDNLLALKHLDSMVQELDVKCRTFTFSNVNEAYQCALENSIHLFIIDIILDTSKPGDTSGLKYIESMRKLEQYLFTPVIFVTSLEDAKLFTYETLHCYNFIEKPFDHQRVKEIITQCLKFPTVTEKNKMMYFRKDGIIFAAEQRNIVFVECQWHNLRIHMKDKDILEIPYVTIKKFLTDADNVDFIQCSRSVVINKKFISTVDFTNRMIQMIDGLGQVEIGIRYKNSLKEILG